MDKQLESFNFSDKQSNPSDDIFSPADSVNQQENGFDPALSGGVNKKKTIVSIEKLSEFDVHIGLKSNHWNPKMEGFIYKKKNNTHIIDIRKSVFFLEKSYMYISDLVKAGIDIMFVCVKNKTVAPIVKDAAKRVNAYYLTQRWLGGLLTNFQQISKTIKKLNELDELISNRELSSKYTKKELGQFIKERNKLEHFYSGIKNLTKVPNLLVVFNPVEDHQAVLEARKIGIPIVALSNTNTNPDLIDFIIPGNSNSPKSVYLIANILCDAIAEVNGQETLIVNKPDSEITVPEEYLQNKWNPAGNERGKTILV